MNLHNVDLGKLHAFRAVYATSSVREAARLLNLTPSAVSAALRSFEDSLKVPLFLRAGRRLTPTAAAAKLEQLAAPFLADVDAFISGSRGGADSFKGVIRIGLPANYAVTVAVPAIGAFRRTHPAVEFKARLADTSVLIEELKAGRFDMVVCDDGPFVKRLTGVAASEVARETLVLACTPQLVREHLQDGFGKASLQRAPHVAYAENQQDLHKWYTHHFGRAPRVNTPLVIGDPRAVRAAVSAGLGLGLLPVSMIEEELADGRLVAVRTRKRPLESRMLLMQNKDHMPTAAERAFVAALKSSF